MEVIINKPKLCPFNEVELGKTFVTENNVLMMKISEQTAICFADEEVYFFKGNEMCTIKVCIIIEKDLLENLKRGAGEYE